MEILTQLDTKKIIALGSFILVALALFLAFGGMAVIQNYTAPEETATTTPSGNKNLDLEAKVETKQGNAEGNFNINQ